MRVRGFVGFVGVLALFSMLGEAQAQSSDKKVKTEFSISKIGADGKQTITITLTPEKGWYVYANPVGNEDLTSSQTVVSVSVKGKVATKINYPAGQVVMDKVVGDYKVHKMPAVITVDIERAVGDNNPIDVSVRFMSCNGAVCLQPSTVKHSFR